MRTPLKKARHLGSAKEGSDHFWKQRVTAVSNLVLVLFLVWFIASLAGAGQPAVKQALANPLVALAFSALIISGTIHMRLGMQRHPEACFGEHGEVIGAVSHGDGVG